MNNGLKELEEYMMFVETCVFYRNAHMTDIW